MAAISENIETLISRLEEQKLQDPVFQPTPYWENYTGRIVKGIQIRGLSQFRADYEIAKGYGAIQPLAAEFPWEKLPDVNILQKIKNYLNVNVQRMERSATAYYQKSIEYGFRYLQQDKHAKRILECTEDSNSFGVMGQSIDGRFYTPNFLRHVALLSIFQDLWGNDLNFNAVLEIGSGYGALPHLCLKLKMDSTITL